MSGSVEGGSDFVSEHALEPFRLGKGHCAW